MHVQTHTSGGWYLEDGEVVVPVTHLVQLTLRPSPLQVSIVPPDGWVPAALPEGASVVGDALVWEVEASGVVTLEFRLVRAEQAAIGRPVG